MLALVLALTFVAPGDPLAQVPPVRWLDPDTVAQAWREVRGLRVDPPLRVKELYARGLDHSACRGLVDLRTLDSELRWQDDVALRHWVRPAFARALLIAHERWRQRWPKQALGVGDIAQAGCGQVDPGTLTRWVEGDDARALLGRASLVAGRPIELAREGDILAERRVVGRDGDTLLVHLRRYRARKDPAIVELDAKARAIADGGVLVHELEGPGPDGATEWRQHWIDPKGHRQMIVVVSERRRPFRLADARDVRIGPWAPARPGELRGDRRWIRGDDAAHPWSAWSLIEEGAHATHMSGLDADLSYPMRVPARRFATDPAGIDLAAAWDWFVTLYDTAAALGTPIDRFVVGGQVLPRLLGAVPPGRARELVKLKLFKVVPNHDDHQHVRLAIPKPDQDLASLLAEPALEPGRDATLDERPR